MNITEPIRRRAHTAPDTTALIWDIDHTLTYRSLEQRIDSAAAHAAAIGLRPGDIVGFDLPSVPHFIYALGLARLGVTSAVPELPEGQRITLTSAPPTRPTELRFDPGWLQTGPAEPQPIHQHGDALCRIVSSSGTTGRPKFIPRSHAVLIQRIINHWLDEGPEPGGIRLIASPLGASGGFNAAIRTLFEGATILITDIDQVADALQRHRVTSLTASPFLLRNVLERLPADAPPPPHLRAIESGGGRIPAALWAAITARLCPNVLNHYGATEVGRIASGTHADLANRPGAAGFLCPGITLQTVDAADQPLPSGQTGTIRVRSDAMHDHYLAPDPAQAANFRHGWFYPGDIGHLDPDRMLILQGRITELINCGGVKINPVDVEDALLTLPGVTDAAAFGVPDAFGVMQLRAAISATRVVPTAELNALCAQSLPGKAPGQIMQVQHMPRTTNGKIRKDLLVAFAISQQRQDTAPS